MAITTNNQEHRHARKLNTIEFIAISFPVLPVSIGMFCLALYLPKYYAIDMGIGLGVVGLVLGIGRLFDMFTDPLAGFLSDQTRTRFGSRKPWVAIAFPLYCLSAYAFCNPPDGAGIVYLIVVSTAYFLALTAYAVPFGALALEISSLKNERSRLFSLRLFIGLIGSAIAGLLPFILATELSQSLRTLSYILLILFLPAYFLFVYGAPTGVRQKAISSMPLKEALRAAWNRPDFRRICLVWLFIQPANTLHVALTLLFVTYVMGDEQVMGIFFLASAIGTAISLPIWYFLSKRIGKSETWQISILVICGAFLAAAFLREGNVLPGAACAFVVGACLACDGLMPASMIADIVHKNEVEDGQKLGGISGATMGFITKMSIIAPMAFAFPVLGLLGLGKTDEFTSNQHYGLIGFYLILPIVLRLIGLFILSRSPLSIHSNP